MSSYDVIVIGGGPGGYVAAIRASQLGLKTAVVESTHLGGICLNWGCIPTKALLRSAEIYHHIKHAKNYGLTVSGVTVDMPAIVARSRGVAKQLSGGIAHLLKKNKVEVITGHGSLLGGGKVAVKGEKEQTLTGKHIILATGARARVLPGFEPDGKLVLTYREAMVQETLPKTLAIVGSGAIGMEFASFYNTLGSKVTVIEAMDRILPAEDAEISGLAKKSFEKQGMSIHVGAKLAKLTKGKDDVTLTFEKSGKTESLTVDRVIMAVGIVPNTETIGLEKTKIRLDRGHIVTDGYLKTDEAGVYALGDVTAGPWLAHKASHEAIICVEKLAGQPGVHPMDRAKIPGCTYTMPQVASVGLSEAKAKEAGHTLKIGRFPFMGNGKAIALGDPEGLVKTIYDAKTGELLGAHLIGAEVTELIQGFVIAMNGELTELDLAHTVFPHPTLSEMMHEATLDALGRVIHF
jgi:dihydrolipoamide dehydrogenase